MTRFSRTFLRRLPTALFILGGSGVSAYVYRSALSDSSDPSSQHLNTRTFVPFTLTSKTRVSSSSVIFTLHRDADSSADAVRDVRSRGVWSVQAKQPALQIARSYTPLPPSGDDDVASGAGGLSLRLLIRREEGGEVSGYLHRLPEQATVELRGPHVELEIPRDVREVVFLAGGTGIAPALQVADLLAGRVGEEKEGVRMSVLWANRRREECVGGKSEGTEIVPEERPSRWWSLFGQQKAMGKEVAKETEQKKGVVVAELDMLKSRFVGKSRMTVDYFVDDEGKFITKTDILRTLRQNSNKAAPSPPAPLTGPEQHAGDKKLILISGPDGFVDHFAGKKAWVDGREAQGALGGVLSELDLRGWRVWKL